MRIRNLCMGLCAALLLLPGVSVMGASETEAANMPPIAENLDLTTFRGVSVGGVLKAVDPEGDSISFEISTPPGKGEVALEEDGHFVYTPAAGRRGKDYFGYRATDEQGNVSQEATVIIRLVRQKTKVTYADMSGQAAEYASLVLAEEGLFTGERLAGAYVFAPETPVTRASFLAMCMALTEEHLLTQVSATGFADDAEIPAWARPYVSTGLYTGIIDGYPSEDSVAVFGSSRAITLGEAAVMLDRAIDVTDTVADTYTESESAWAGQSLSDLIACGILPGNGVSADAILTRGQAASMLVEAMRVLDRR